MSWLETSIMARRGLANGKPGKTYSITEESQGEYHYVYGPYAKPVLKVDPGLGDIRRNARCVPGQNQI